jgi:hypothetical protein
LQAIHNFARIIAEMADQERLEKTERVGDMGGLTRLVIYREPDGDIVVQVIVHDERGFKQADVEFCTPWAGGGKSRETYHSLLELVKAMQKDNEEHPQDLRELSQSSDISDEPIP